MKTEPKNTTRTFEYRNCLDVPNLRKWADDVVGRIETDQLLVLDPRDTEALHSVFDERGRETLLFDRAAVPIRPAEWFGVLCQRIRYSSESEETAHNDSALLRYHDNGAMVLWPCGGAHRPQGPSAFIGEIAVGNATLTMLLQERGLIAEAMFKAALARVLVHVLDVMRLVVPAFLDWKSFWPCVLGRGSHTNMLIEWKKWAGDFADRDLEEYEIEGMRTHWPVLCRTWLGARQAETCRPT